MIFEISFDVCGIVCLYFLPHLLGIKLISLLLKVSTFIIYLSKIWRRLTNYLKFKVAFLIILENNDQLKQPNLNLLIKASWVSLLHCYLLVAMFCWDEGAEWGSSDRRTAVIKVSQQIIIFWKLLPSQQ